MPKIRFWFRKWFVRFKLFVVPLPKRLRREFLYWRIRRWRVRQGWAPSGVLPDEQQRMLMDRFFRR